MARHLMDRIGKDKIALVNRGLVLLMLLASSFFAIQFLVVALSRVGAVFELEWLEGDEFHHAWWIAQGRNWYPPPSATLFPNVYPPLYPALCSLLFLLVGPSLALMRAVSLFSTLACGAFIALTVRRETGSWSGGAIAAGFFLATYGACGFWFDLARVDMLAVALALAGAYFAGHGASRTSYGAGLLLLCLSVLAKQNHLGFLGGVLLAWLFWNWRRAVIGGLVSGFFLAATVAVLETATDGWFSFYAYRIPSGSPFMRDKFVHFVTVLLPSLFGGALFPLFRAHWRNRWRSSLGLLLFPVSVIAGVSSFSVPGGYVNHLVTPAAFGAVAVGMGLGTGKAEAHPRLASVAAWVAGLLVLAQMVILRYDIASNIPTPEDTQRGLAVVEKVRALPAPILAPYHPYLLYLAGHEMNAQFHMINEMKQSKLGDTKVHGKVLLDEISSGLRSGLWRTCIGSEIQGIGMASTVCEDFVAGGSVRPVPLAGAGDGRTLFPLTGNPIRPGIAFSR